MSMGLRLAALRAAGAPLLRFIFTDKYFLFQDNCVSVTCKFVKRVVRKLLLESLMKYPPYQLRIYSEGIIEFNVSLLLIKIGKSYQLACVHPPLPPKTSGREFFLPNFFEANGGFTQAIIN